MGCALVHTKLLNSVTDCARGGKKDALRLCAYSGKNAQTDQKYSFSPKVIFWMVISYMAETSAGAKVILQSTHLAPHHPGVQSS